MDHGQQGLATTIHTLQVNGTAYFGVGEDVDEAVLVQRELDKRHFKLSE